MCAVPDSKRDGVRRVALVAQGQLLRVLTREVDLHTG